MDTFVKEENEMWKLSAKERIETRIVSASAVKRELDFRHRLSVCSATDTDVQVKKTPRLLCSNNPWLQKCVKTSLERTSDYSIQKCFPYLDQHRLHLWTHTFCNTACRFCARLTDGNLQSQLHCAVTPFQQNCTKLIPDSIRCCINGEYISLFISM